MRLRSPFGSSLLVLAALALAGASCVPLGGSEGEGSGCGGGAPGCRFDRMQVLPGSTATFTIFGAASATAAVGDGHPCVLEWNSSDFDTLPQGGLVATNHWLNLACSQGESSITLTLSDLLDPRQWPRQSDVAVASSDAAVFAVKQPGVVCNSSALSGLVVHLDTEESVGTSAPGDAVVTPDYARTFALRLDTEGTSPTSGGNDCSPSTNRIAATLRLRQTASDWTPIDCPIFCR